MLPSGGIESGTVPVDRPTVSKQPGHDTPQRTHRKSHRLLRTRQADELASKQTNKQTHPSRKQLPLPEPLSSPPSFLVAGTPVASYLFVTIPRPSRSARLPRGLYCRVSETRALARARLPARRLVPPCTPWLRGRHRRCYGRWLAPPLPCPSNIIVHKRHRLRPRPRILLERRPRARPSQVMPGAGAGRGLGRGLTLVT